MRYITILKKLNLSNYYINKLKKNPSNELFKDNLKLIKKYYSLKKQLGGGEVNKEMDILLKMIEDLLKDKIVKFEKLKAEDVINKKKIQDLEKKVKLQEAKITSLKNLTTGEKQRYDQIKQLLHRFQDKNLRITKKSYWPLASLKNYVKSMLKKTWKDRDNSLLNFLIEKEISPYYQGSVHLKIKGVPQYIDKRKAPKKLIWMGGNKKQYKKKRKN